MWLYEDKIRDARLGWFDYMKRRSMDAPMKRCEKIIIHVGKRGRV